MFSRRSFLLEMPAAALAVSKAARTPEEVQTPKTQTDKARIIVPLVNHVGYRPSAGKFVVIEDLPSVEGFELVRIHRKGNPTLFAGKFLRAGDDFGPYLIGDFSSFREPGVYRVNVSLQNLLTGVEKLAAGSNDFTIGEKVWDRSPWRN